MPVQIGHTSKPIVYNLGYCQDVAASSPFVVDVEHDCRTHSRPAVSGTWYRRRAVETSKAFSWFVLGFPTSFFPSDCRTQEKMCI